MKRKNEVKKQGLKRALIKGGLIMSIVFYVAIWALFGGAVLIICLYRMGRKE